LLGEGGPIVVSSLTFFSVNGEPIKDEYDPSRPNDYEAVREERERKRKEAEEEAERQAKLREIEQVRCVFMPAMLSLVAWRCTTCTPASRNCDSAP